MENHSIDFKTLFKKSIGVLIFNLLFAISLLLAFELGPKGPCNGGLAALEVLFVAVPISVIILLYYIVTGISEHKKVNLYVGLIHLFICIAFFFLSFIV
ncbi:MAG TPA: hypothetical protein VK783_06155 [Bacteroidia bacterium]|jgi:hypothetical protein|nr:hypothetical protein [Bacteroidia bacterium]